MTISDQSDAEADAIVKLPDWLYGGDPEAFGLAANWTMEPLDRDTMEWRIRLTERVTSPPVKLIKLTKLATAENVDSNVTFAPLSRLATSPDFTTSPHINIERELRLLASERPDDLAAKMYGIILSTQSVPDGELAQQVQDNMRYLLSIFPDAACYLIELSPAVAQRYAATRVLLQTEDDAGLLTRRPKQAQDGLIFKSGQFLFPDTLYTLKAYLDPLFTSLSPWVWAVSAARPSGVVVYSFGDAVIGRRGEVAELLQLFLPAGSPTSGPKPTITPLQFESALKWWIEHLSSLFTEITDPTHYINEASTYDATSNFKMLLSIEQAFRNVQVLGASYRDRHSRLGLMFDTLDMIGGIRGPDFDAMCKLTETDKALSQLNAKMEEDARAVLSPRAVRARDALSKVKDGFFLSSRVTDVGVLLPGKKSPSDAVATFEIAVAEYLRVLRNAGHSFVSHEGKDSEPRKRALLISHDGNLPLYLPDLAYLFLLRLLARPEDLNRRKSRGKARRSQGGGDKR